MERLYSHAHLEWFDGAAGWNNLRAIMLSAFRDLFDRQRPVPRKGTPLIPERPSGPPAGGGSPKQVFTKVFRWRLPDGQTQEPDRVEVVGSFTHWKPTPLVRDGKLDAWHVMVHHIPGNRTHHYMLLVDGHPTYDPTCDGLAVPHGPMEEQFQLKTDKGPRLLMMFAQTR